ncbi:hypothetical protein SAMN05443287_11355 [Micromonospora phaseoli]|uniref:Uncharacterized protein n=1 Tax=Micromonospora phaseoli TaxID=1144548 RepID=A0A1H7DD57_9ACTN|nr:hypothetical protein [Micromonospora phaseoli]PZV90542.1 hypothetical protein CLV64_11382 [Micromonospora phaseoli]GIJ78067.1 hypothetical protein Xph01_24990 [Micromonospora phaseoli]SEJ99749.1 hypothetical protein SAMN05443287_11355 [Micromonospora phaseoli]
MSTAAATTRSEPATDVGPPSAEPTGTAAGGWDQVERRARASQSFWTAVVGVPAIFSVLRLGVEAGGELQTTLLLVANVGPVNLLAGFLTTAARLLSTVLVAVFALGGVLAASAHGMPRRPLLARWMEITPSWFVTASFLIALVTWPLLYLPLLLPTLAAAFQLRPERLHEHPVVRALIVAAGYAGYLWLLLPTLRIAWREGATLPILLLVVPPLLALFVAGPLPGVVIRPLASVTQLAVLVVLAWAALPVISTPVLPLTVTTVGTSAEATEEIRGHVVTTDDVNMVILQERGGVRYVPVEQVRGQVLCPSEEELPRHQLRIHDFHVEDSLLEGLGRRVRPVHRMDAACR